MRQRRLVEARTRASATPALANTPPTAKCILKLEILGFSGRYLKICSNFYFRKYDQFYGKGGVYVFSSNYIVL